MAIPVYLWLKDDGGADIKGSVDVKDREGSIEVVAQEHNLYIPTDNNTGKLTGTRIHTPFLFTKEIDSSSPYLYKAVTTGQPMRCNCCWASHVTGLMCMDAAISWMFCVTMRLSHLASHGGMM